MALEERGFEALVRSALRWTPQDHLVLDARELTSADAFGAVGLLAVGRWLARGGRRPTLQLSPRASGFAHLAGLGFVEAASEVFKLSWAEPPPKRAPQAVALIPATPISSADDAWGVVDRLSEVDEIRLHQALGYDAADAADLRRIVAELLDNLVQHAGSPGWVCAEVYPRLRRLDRAGAVIAVMDLGVSFRESLGRGRKGGPNPEATDSWALQATLLHGVRHQEDPERGRGLAEVNERVRRLGGVISIRSGTARIAADPEWDEPPAVQSGLPPFPGAQVLVVLPAKTA
ncbi:hypothetical protein BH23GEM5_BH23GEM5_03060 [soil metagenome]